MNCFYITHYMNKQYQTDMDYHPSNIVLYSNTTVKKDEVTDTNNDGLNDYQKLRAKNIERNNARLRSLGLISALEEKQSNASAWGRSLPLLVASENESDDDDDEEEDWVGDDDKASKSKPKNRKRIKSDRQQGSRKSLRLQGIGADGNSLVADLPIRDQESIRKEREQRVKECREARLRAAKAVAEAGAEVVGKENPTATYGHCLMRVKTMTEKGLANRVSAYYIYLRSYAR